MGTADLLRLLSLFTVLQQVKSWVINVPKTVVALEGSCVVVPCRTEIHDRVSWYRSQQFGYPVVYDGHHPDKVEQQFKGRTSLLGEAAKGNCTLKIDDVRKSDNKLEIYVWINPDTLTTHRFYDQTVTIFVQRKTPVISVQTIIVDGEFFQVNCSIFYSCLFKPPTLTWNRSPFLETSNITASSGEAHGLWFYTETLYGLATHEMHEQTISCLAHFRIFTTESRIRTLHILYKPVSVTLKLEQEPVLEFSSVITECAAKCNPQPHLYSWLRSQAGEIIVTNSTERKMSFHNMTRRTSLSCRAHNDIGVGQSSWLEVDVQYAPVILPESYCRRNKGVLQCLCKATASPNASILWSIDGRDSVPTYFSLVTTIEQDIISVVMSGPAHSHSNISCTATNMQGSKTKWLHVVDLSSFLSPLFALLLLPVIVLLVGLGMFIYRKYYINRPFSVHRDHTYNNTQRQVTDQELDRHSVIYGNVFADNVMHSIYPQHCHNTAAENIYNNWSPDREQIS